MCLFKIYTAKVLATKVAKGRNFMKAAAGWISSLISTSDYCLPTPPLPMPSNGQI